MGYGVPGEAYLSNNSVAYNDGSPLCGQPESPANCQANTAYGQNFACNATGWQFPEKGHNLYFRVGCDMGRGHSGSALGSDYPGQNGPSVLGITIWQHCYRCGDAQGSYRTHPNGYRKMNPWLANFLSKLRVQYP